MTPTEGFVRPLPLDQEADANDEPRNHPHFDRPVIERRPEPAREPRRARPAEARQEPPPRVVEPTDDEVAAAADANVAKVEATAPPPETWPIKVKLLHKQTRNNKNEPIGELSFREPTGGDINRYGNPVRIDQDGEIIIDERKMTAMISILSGVLLPFIEALDPRDWNSCAYRLRGFFLPNTSAW